uniref:Uncharacterized protein n=1 Tax=Anguilla anguilla TaxID=7936 RepID=A0A0E9QJA8_ANGAN
MSITGYTRMIRNGYKTKKKTENEEPYCSMKHSSQKDTKLFHGVITAVLRKCF